MGKDRTVSHVEEQNALFEVAFFSTMGDRANQQDSYAYSLDDNGGIFTICDGMGGHRGGAEASAVASRSIVEDYRAEVSERPVSDILIDSARRADTAVAGLTDENGVCMYAGSTMVTVVIQDHHLHWLSVGDSRIYLKRGKEFIQITFDHIYRAVLNEQLQTNEITEAEYQREAVRGESLISYIGVGELNLIDYNDETFELQSGDVILMMSDGLYKIVSDEEIHSLLENFQDIGDATQVLETRAARNAARRNVRRDNMTFAIIKMK